MALTHTRTPLSLFEVAPVDVPTDPRFLSRDACRALADRIFALRHGGGSAYLAIDSQWSGNLRWARNVVTSGGDTTNTELTLSRTIRGASTNGSQGTNTLTDDALAFLMRRAEERTVFQDENPDDFDESPAEVHPHSQPAIWFDSTYNLDAGARGALATTLIAPAKSENMVAAGYVRIAAAGMAVLTTDTVFRYYPLTKAQYSVTIRDPKNAASGWAGVDFSDWGRINALTLTRRALEKCRSSRNPVAIEPGRFTTILEPQAVCDLFAPILDRAMDRQMAEQGMGPFAAGGGNSKIGQQVLDARLTLSADPMDPDLGFVPFDWSGEPYLKTAWIDRGVLKELAYRRSYGLTKLGKDWALPSSGAFRLSGGTATIDDMIASIPRGVLVTRLSNVEVIDFRSMLLTGTTRDGLWLIERGKISKAIKNFRFTESPLFVGNNVEQLGVPQRTFRPDAPAVCPPMMVRDFSFTGLADAV